MEIESYLSRLSRRFTLNSGGAKWEGLYKRGGLHLPRNLSVTKGRHTVKFTRRGPLPHLLALRLDTPTAFPKGWKQPRRKVELGRIPPRYRSVFLPPDAVNVAPLRLANQDTIKTFGPRYPGGEQYLKQLSELEAKQSAAEGGPAEDERKIEDALAALRRRAMLAHPALKFDKLLFLKRTSHLYGHTYADQNANNMGGNLCILSPVAPDGKVAKLVPELDGGLFDRFDLSLDATKVVFGYKRAPKKPFRIHEVDIDPSTGLMAPGSLRQLTFDGGDEDAEASRRSAGRLCHIGRGFDDMDPCYLPNGKIMFTSSARCRSFSVLP